jgi:hypothetical protein
LDCAAHAACPEIAEPSLRLTCKDADEQSKFLEEADEFISKIDSKPVKKSFSILTLLNKPMIQDFSRNCKMIFASFGQSPQNFKSDFLHFGTNQITKRLW